MQKRPSDLTIRIGRIIFGLILSTSLYYNFFYQTEANNIENILLWQKISIANLEYIKYAFVFL
jgi:hypothetical protein